MNDLFFTLLLYKAAKQRRYRFYDCLVAHEGAYIDLNRFVEPTDTLSVTYKIAYDDALEDAGWADVRGHTQQFIVCCRTSISDTNGITLCAYPYYPTGNPTTANVQRGEYTFIDNGDASQSVARRLYPKGFDKKIVVEFTPQQTRVYCVKTEILTTYNLSSARSLTQGQGRALLKLFAGFEYAQGMFAANGCDSRIYSFSIKNANDVYTVRLQPAEDLNTGELGMYDSVNDKFYPNKNSVGYFTVENNITDKIILDVESQIDTRKWQILFTSNNMPFQLSNGQLCAVPVDYSTPPLFANPNGTPATDGDFIDAWIRMGLPSDEVGLFNNTVLNRNQNSDVTYINNGDGSVTIKVGDDESPDGDYTRYAYQLNDIALSMVLIGNFEDIEYSDNSGFIIVTRPVGTNLNGGFRWRDIKSGRKAKNFLKDGESAGAQDIFFDTETSAVWAATGSTNQTGGDTLIGVMDNRPMGLRIYGMALYRGIHTTAELLQVAEWLDSLTKRPVQTREITSES